MQFLNKYTIHIKNILYSLITYISILIYFNLFFESVLFNILITPIFVLLLLFFYKINISNDKRIKKFSYILSLVLSCFLSIGHIVYPSIPEGAINIFNLRNIIYALIFICGFFLILSRLFSLLFSNINKIKIFENERTNKNTFKFFLLVLGIILICWIPYFLRFFPAIMTYDSYHVINHSNSYILSDYHTFAHTWFFGIFFNLGKLLFSNMNMAVAFSMIIQMITMASIFAYCVIYLYKKGLKKCLCVLCTAIYALSPLHAHYSITLWRDIVFGGVFVLLFISLYEIISCKENLKKSIIGLLMTSLLFILFFRHNGIYICILLLPFILFSKILRKKLIIITYIFLLVFYFVIKGPVFDYFNVKKTTTREAVSIPLQQICRTVAMGKEIDEKSKNYLSEILQIDLVDESYLPYISDPIKDLLDNEKLAETSGTFFKIWFKNLIKYPQIYIEAYLTQTLGYWYPDVKYWAVGGESKSIFDNLNVYSDPITPAGFNNFIDTISSRKTPFSNLIYSVGATTFILIISTFIFVYNNRLKYLLAYIPLYLLLFTILISTPVFCELRYVYGLFTCVPLLLTIPFIKIEKNKEKD